MLSAGAKKGKCNWSSSTVGKMHAGKMEGMPSQYQYEFDEVRGLRQSNDIARIKKQA